MTGRGAIVFGIGKPLQTLALCAVMIFCIFYALSEPNRSGGEVRFRSYIDEVFGNVSETAAEQEYRRFSFVSVSGSYGYTCEIIKIYKDGTGGVRVISADGAELSGDLSEEAAKRLTDVMSEEAFFRIMPKEQDGTINEKTEGKESAHEITEGFDRGKYNRIQNSQNETISAVFTETVAVGIDKRVLS